MSRFSALIKNVISIGVTKTFTVIKSKAKIQFHFSPIFAHVSNDYHYPSSHNDNLNLIGIIFQLSN